MVCIRHLAGLTFGRRTLRNALCVAGLVAGALPAQATLAYSYTGNALTYSPSTFTTYGARVVATLSFDESLLGAGLSGTLAAGQFVANLGTSASTFALQAAGTYVLPTGGAAHAAYVTVSQGRIVDWDFGTLYFLLGNQITVASSGAGDTILPFPRVVAFGTASASAGTWSLQSVAPVPLPAVAGLFAAGLAALARSGTRRRTGH